MISRRAFVAAATAMLPPLGAARAQWGGPPVPPPGEGWFVGTMPDEPFDVELVDLRRVDPALHRQLVDFDGPEQPGSLVVDPDQRFLYLVREGRSALRYGVGVGRMGFGWSGTAQVMRKARWPSWRPTEAMLRRLPELPVHMVGGPENPLGARALYLYQGDRDTLYRIHGTNEPWTIGDAVSSGCVRLFNEDICDLYNRVPVGTMVHVRPSTPSLEVRRDRMLPRAG